jgi:hypothetical protein
MSSLLSWHSYVVKIGGKELRTEKRDSGSNEHLVSSKNPNFTGFVIYQHSPTSTIIRNDFKEVFLKPSVGGASPRYAVEMMAHTRGKKTLGNLHYDSDVNQLIVSEPNKFTRRFTIIEGSNKLYLAVNGSAWLYCDEYGSFKTTENPYEHPLWPHAFYADFIETDGPSTLQEPPPPLTKANAPTPPTYDFLDPAWIAIAIGAILIIATIIFICSVSTSP